MNDEKVYYPETINENPFPNSEDEITIESTQSSANDTYSPVKIQNNSLPTKRIAQELLSSALNTRSRNILQEFTLTDSGGFQIGKFELGQNGDIRITQNGIVARSSDGNISFSLDGTDGSAVFRGKIQSGSLVTGQVIVGTNNIIIDGESRQIIVNDGEFDRVLIGYQKDGF